MTWFTSPEELDARCFQGKTALHLATERGNLFVVEELVRAGASLDVRCDAGERPEDVVGRLCSEKVPTEKLRELLYWWDLN